MYSCGQQTHSNSSPPHLEPRPWLCCGNGGALSVQALKVETDTLRNNTSDLFVQFSSCWIWVCYFCPSAFGVEYCKRRTLGSDLPSNSGRDSFLQPTSKAIASGALRRWSWPAETLLGCCDNVILTTWCKVTFVAMIMLSVHSGVGRTVLGRYCLTWRGMPGKKERRNNI